MGFGALIGAGISAAATIGSQAYASSQSGGGGGPNAGTLKRARQIYVDPYTNQGYWNLDVPSLAQSALSAGEPLAAQANRFNQGQLTNMLNAVMPGYQNMFNQMGQNVSMELAGQVPTDVQNQLQRFGAQEALTSGIGGGGIASQIMGKTITARDLGLTSLDLMGKGEAGLGSMFGMARNYMMPQLASAQSMIPLSIMIGARQWQDQALFEANLAGYTASAQMAGANVQFPNQTANQIAGIGGTAGGFLSGLGQTNPNTGQSGFDLLGQLFGGSGVSGLSGSGFGSTGGVGYSGTGDLFNTVDLSAF